MEYLYETHLHTNKASACGKSSGAEHVRYYHSLGFTGLFVTDHFFRGNCKVPRSLSWKTRVELYCQGYYEALDEGRRCGLDVFFGWEETFEGDDYLVYGLSPEWLMNHPEAEHWTHRQQYEEVHKAGGCVVQAHPFRSRDYITEIILNKDYVDAVEVANAGNKPADDTAALRYARTYGFYETCGSDIHYSGKGVWEANQIYGMALNKRLSSEADYVQIILNREPVRLCVPEERFASDEKVSLPIYWIDGEERRFPAWSVK